MLKNIDPPLGFGRQCPNRFAYKKLVRMNMPIDQEKKVNFTTTLFALIRENLNIKMRAGNFFSFVNTQKKTSQILNMFIFNKKKIDFTAEEMDTADEELRDTIRIIWPLQARKMTDLLVPRREVVNKNSLTVGKIYAAHMILESWRSTRFGKRKSRFGVRFSKLFIH